MKRESCENHELSRNCEYLTKFYPRSTVYTGRRIKWYKSGDLPISEQATTLAIWSCGLTVL